MACERCGAGEDTRFVCFRQNIGLAIRRLVSRFEGWFCGPCIQRTYLETRTVNRWFGHWGAISSMVAPYYRIANWFQWLRVNIFVTTRFDRATRRRICREARAQAWQEIREYARRLYQG
jgi:hypothetical protein